MRAKTICAELKRGIFSGDLSGFPFTDCGPIKAYHIVDSTLRGSSFVNLSIRGSRFQRVDFAKADLTDTADHGNEFSECDFARTVFRGATIGFDGSTYRHCTFSKVPFQGAGFVRPIFEDCRFLDISLRNIDFEASCFRRCKFSGRLRDVWFRNGFSHPALADDFGRPMINDMLQVDLSEATLWGVGFSGGLDLATVTPPQDGKHRLYDRWRSRFAAVRMKVSALPAEVQKGVRKFMYAFEPSSEHQDYYIVNVTDLNEMFGVEATEAILACLGPGFRG